MRDQLQAFILNQKQYRGVLVHLDASYQKILHLHAYPTEVGIYLGQLLAAAGLLGNNLKQAGRLGLQIQTDQLIKFIVAEINHTHGIRGLAQWRNDIFPNNGLLATGKFVMTLSPEKGERYQGIVPIVGDNIADSLQAYYTQSEQIFTRICLAANETAAAGLLIQKLPTSKTSEESLDLDAMKLIINTIRPEELLTDEPATLLPKLFHDFSIEVFSPERIHFECTCTQEKMTRAIRLLGKEEIDHILSTHKTVDVTCEFCNDHYQFTREEVERLF